MSPGPGGVPAIAERRWGRAGAGGYAFALCLVLLAACGLVGMIAHQPFLFPSLGPTVMLLVEDPRQASASPRSTLVGHGVAVVVGAACLALFGLADHPPVTQEGLTGARTAAAALSVAVTALVLRLLATSHPPAGATTLIVSLGILTSASELLTIVLAVVLVTALAVGLSRLLGAGLPLWR